MPRSIIRLSLFLPRDNGDKLSVWVILCTPSREDERDGGREEGWECEEMEGWQGRREGGMVRTEGRKGRNVDGEEERN